MSWDTNLTGAHLQIAQSTAQRLRVMAGPGTGKTLAMKRRIAKLIEVDGIKPERILAVTFTRTAAGDLKRELHSLDVPGCEEIRAGTVHAFCFHLLRKNDVFGFLGRVPRGLLSFDKSKIARFELEPLIEDLEVLGRFGGKRHLTKRIRAFEAAWARLQHEQPGWPADPVDQEFHERLTDWLRFHRAMLIGELVPEALRYLRNNPASPTLQSYDHIVVDEYQDLNRAEQELIDVLSTDRHLAIVGDVDQSIYRFRHAHPEGISHFSNRHQNVEDHTIRECWRCRASIVKVADNVILRNYPPGSPSRLLPMQSQPGPAVIRVVQWPTLESQAQGIGAFIQSLVTRPGIGAGDILVLSPRRLIANQIKQCLAHPAARIAAHSFYNDKLLEPEEAQLSMTKLQLLSNQEDRVALRFWLGFGSADWSRAEYSLLRVYCQRNGESPGNVLRKVIAGHLTLPGVEELIKRIRQLDNEIARLGNMTVDALFDDLFPLGATWAVPIRELVTGKIDGIADASELLDLLRSEITQPEMPSQGDYVRLMSIHKSKGLTSRIAIIVGCIHGLIPFVDDELTSAKLQAHKEEQRRLFYVGLTRAKEILVLSSVRSIPRQMAHKIGAVVRGGNREFGDAVACEYLEDLGTLARPALLGTAWMAGGFQ